MKIIKRKVNLENVILAEDFKTFKMWITGNMNKKVEALQKTAKQSGASNPELGKLDVWSKRFAERFAKREKMVQYYKQQAAGPQYLLLPVHIHPELQHFFHLPAPPYPAYTSARTSSRALRSQTGRAAREHRRR